MDTFIDVLVKRVHPMVVGKLNSDAYSTKHAEAIVKQVAEATANEILKGYWEDTVIDTASNMKNICNEIISQCKGDSNVK